MKKMASPTRTREILKQYGLHAKKSLGQNFMIDSNILQQMLQAAELEDQAGVIEIGPGLGALTEMLAAVAERVVAYEIDRRFIQVLEDHVGLEKHVHILHKDVLKSDLLKDYQHYFNEQQKISVVANLPYYITTPILFHLLNSAIPFQHMVLLVQKEVAERLSAVPGTKAYNALSISVQFRTQASVIQTVPRTVFIPQPNVDSAIIKLTRRSSPAVLVKNEHFFFQLVRICFTQRRKTLWNNLQHHVVLQEHKPFLQHVLDEAQIDGGRRAETLSMDEFALLSDLIGDSIPSLTRTT